MISLSIHDIGIIHRSLADEYNLLKKSLDESDFSELSEQQLINACRNVYELFKRIDSLVDNYKVLHKKDLQ